MEMFSGQESATEAIKLAYGMEIGLGEFYTKMADQSDDREMADVLMKLAGIEEKHKMRLLDVYRTMADSAVEQEAFERDILAETMEGGFTTDEFISRYQPFMKNAADVLNIAMMLETQAMDLYMRFSDKSTADETKKILLGLAEEEKAHLKRLGELLDTKI